MKQLMKFVLAVFLMGVAVAMAAFDPVNDDTDIFLANPSIAAERPNVLLVVDNSANWNQAFTNEKAALVQVINGLSDQYNVGLMIMSDSNFKRTGSSGSDGSYVRYHVRQMTTANKSSLASIIANFDINGDKGDNNLAGLALYEAYLYFAGKASRAGDDQSKADHDGTADPFLTPLTPHSLPYPGSGTFPTEGSLFRSPIEDGCARNFIIFISNGPANENATARAELEGYLGTLTGVSPPSIIGVTPNGLQGNWSDEMAKFMANADVFATDASVSNSDGAQNVYTYVVEVNPGTTGTGPDMTALMKSVANNGKGKYFGVTSDASGTAIVDALNSIFTEVQAVNSVFASTTLPVSVNVRGTNLNQVYIGVFRPDSNKSPRWLGNLKMYNLALDTATNRVFLADAANGPPPAVGDPAENTTTGFVSQNSPSFWTAASNYWGFRDPSQNGPGGPSDLPDGDLVEKGGAAQQLRIAYASAESSSPLRNVYTCTTGLVSGVNQTCAPNVGFALSNTPFSTANDAVSPAAFQLDTRFVSPLSAYTSQSVTSVTDRLSVALSNTWAGANSRFVTSLSNNAVTRTILSLTTAVPRPVTSVQAHVPNVQTVALSSVGKVPGNVYRFQAAQALPGNFVNGASVVVSGASNSLFNVTWTIDTVDTTNNRFTITGGPGGNESATGGTATVTSGQIESTTAQAYMPAHGFTNGQQVTIAGASPVQFNGTFGITVVDVDHFNYTMSQAGGDASGAITATGNTTTATATTSGAHGFFDGSTVAIAGASDPAYNITATIGCTPSPLCDGATTFSYTLATATAPNTNVSGVTATQGGGTTVTVTVSGTHFYADGQTIFISGSDIAGYNGSFTINCPACDPVLGSTASFEITTASVLPQNTSNVVYAATSTSRFVLGFAPNHGFAATDGITIEGAAPHEGAFSVIDNFSTDYWFYFDALIASPPITSSGYTVRPTASNKAWVTLPGHGYAHGQEVRIAGANPSGYDAIANIRVCVPIPFTFSCLNQADVFSYPLTALQGTNISSSVTASIKSTNARATAVNHGFADQSIVAIAGATPGTFNGTYTVTVTGPDTFTYTIASPEGDAAGTIAAAQAGGFSVERDALIRWVRGEDNFQDENSDGSTTDIRSSIHGDVLHSRPAVVNYNRFAGSDDDVFVFYGGNDGVFHAVKGGYAKPTGDTSSLTPGKEAWGFIPEEFFGQFKRMRNNSPVISSAFKKPYFQDGPIAVYTNDANGNESLGDAGDAVNLYVANRRGGRFIYALDVNDPENPKFLWKISNLTAGFGELGQSWSQPTVVTGLANLPFPVLVFGAGYDSAVDDLDPAVVTSVNTTTGAVTTSTIGTVDRAMGRGIYVVNALTGALVWHASFTGSGATLEVAGMIYAIPSDLTVIRNLSGGPTNRAYVGDTGGNVWRIDFSGDGATNLATSTVVKLASLADPGTAAGRRKFLFPPDVVAQDGYDAILLGSGDREHPFDTTVTNRFYMLKDKGTDVGAVTGNTEPTITEQPIVGPPDYAGLSDLTSNCVQDASACLAGETQAAVSSQLGTDRGWFITLGAGEKVVGNAISIAGTTFFNTNQPSATAGGGTCGSNLGVARQYQVGTVDATASSDLNAVGGLTGADRSLIHAGGGYLPSPVHVVVMLGGKPVEAVISGIQVSTPAGTSLSSRLRKYWYKEVDPK